MSRIYLALYKGNGGSLLEKLEDKAIRFFTNGIYSHCEIAIEKRTFHTGEKIPEISYDCYSSSPRDGGVRCKKIAVNDRLKWDLIPLNFLSEAEVNAYFEQTKGAKYDHIGALGVVLPIGQSKSKYFCSEWCHNAIFGGDKGHRYSPNALAKVAKSFLRWRGE